MSVQTNEKLARDLFGAFNERRFDEAAKHVADKVEWRNMATGEVFRGPKGVRQFMEQWTHTFDDARIEPRRIIATENDIVTEFVAKGTHTGPLRTPQGEVPATRRKIELPCCEVVHVKDGKITGGATYLDTASMLHQLGIEEHATASR